jgi:hypothetical protein
MKFIHADHAGNSRLRFVFNGTVVLFSLAADATLEDIALALGGLEPQKYGNPVAIDVTLAASTAQILQRKQIPRLVRHAAPCADGVPNDHQGVFV